MGGSAGCQLTEEGVLGEAAGGIREGQSEGNREGRVRNSRRINVLYSALRSKWLAAPLASPQPRAIQAGGEYFPRQQPELEHDRRKDEER